MRLYHHISEILERKGNKVWSVSPSAPVFEAILRMSKAHVGALLVLEKGRIAGIVSERDYARKVILEGKSSKETLVREIMTSRVISVSSTVTVDECMQIMTAHHIRHLPVMDGQTIVGVVSIGDLVQWTITAYEVMVDQLNNYITGRYPA